MRISDWSSDVCSSDLPDIWRAETGVRSILLPDRLEGWALGGYEDSDVASGDLYARFGVQYKLDKAWGVVAEAKRSEEHTSELQSLMRISYAVFCLKKKNKKNYER